MKKILLLTVWSLLVCLTASAQVYFQNTMYYFNRFAYNPAAAGFRQPGMSDGPNFTLMGRNQWLGIQDAPQTGLFAFNTYLDEYKSGVGATISFDRLGPFSSTKIEAAYAYRFDLGFGELAIGVNGGVKNTVIDGDWVPPTADFDPTIPYAVQSAWLPALGAGIFLNGKDDKFFAGISAQDLLEPSIEALTGDAGSGQESNVPRSFFLTGGYRFELNDRSSLTPTVFLRTDGTEAPQADLSLYWNYKPIVLGANYRFFNDSFSGIIGANVSDRTFFGYSYDYTLNALNRLGNVHSHEFIISYTIPVVRGLPGQRKDIGDDPDPF
ncbi:MAG: type IX secretion system membrane protein PorP/SprF [Bacteroidia bacterium]|nr:type IX secretion system membrane protein PorP/SprF [Bacteroidia bacterium]